MDFWVAEYGCLVVCCLHRRFVFWISCWIICRRYYLFKEGLKGGEGVFKEELVGMMIFRDDEGFEINDLWHYSKPCWRGMIAVWWLACSNFPLVVSNFGLTLFSWVNGWFTCHSLSNHCLMFTFSSLQSIGCSDLCPSEIELLGCESIGDASDITVCHLLRSYQLNQ